MINISSASARLGSPNEYVDYAASKGALETFTIGFAKEVAREGIRVNCIRPGHIYTDIHASGGEPGRVDRVKDSIPMGRGGQPEEVARAILWLAGAEASFITGTFLDVTGMHALGQLLSLTCSFASFTTLSRVKPNLACNLDSGAEAPKLFITTLAPVCPT